MRSANRSIHTCSDVIVLSSLYRWVLREASMQQYRYVTSIFEAEVHIIATLLLLLGPKVPHMLLFV